MRHRTVRSESGWAHGKRRNLEGRDRLALLDHRDVAARAALKGASAARGHAEMPGPSAHQAPIIAR
jgi:hypothetical protein